MIKMGNYDDIINHKYVKNPNRKHMSMVDRASQFGSVKALSGHEDALNETARITEVKHSLDEYVIEEINQKIVYLKDHIDDDILVSITYFIPDSKKQGGKYETIKKTIKKIDEFEKTFITSDNIIIPINDILNIEF